MRLAPWVLLVLILASCGRPEADCASILRDAEGRTRLIRSSSLPLEPHSVRAKLVGLCAEFAALDSVRALAEPGGLEAVEDLLLRESSLLSFAYAAGTAFRDSTATDDSSAHAALAAAVTGFAVLDSSDLAVRMRSVEVSAARQDSAAHVLSESLSALGVHASADSLYLLQLALALLDSARTTLRASTAELLRTASAGVPQDTLGLDLERLRNQLTVLRESGDRFVVDLTDDALVPLPGDRANALEYGWQVRRYIAIAAEVVGVLTASVAQLKLEATGDRIATLVRHLELSVDRAVDIQAALELSGASLDGMQARGGVADSVRRVAEKIQADLVRQRQVLGDAAGHLAELEPIGRASARQASASVELLSDLHGGLEDVTAALVSTMGGDVREYGGKLALAILLIAAAWLLLRGSVRLLGILAERSAARRLFYKKLIPIGRLLVWTITIWIVLAEIFELDSRGLLAAGTALGVAIGFAAQDLLKNVFGGILIIFDQPFQVGDKINIGGTYGEVVTMGLRSTRIVTSDDNLVSVPNAQVVDHQVSNANSGALDCQVVVDLFVPGWTDVQKAKAIAHMAAANSKYIYLEKPIVVNVTDTFKETFLTQLTVKAYVLDARYEFAFASDVTEAAKIEFLRSGFFRQLERDSGTPEDLPEGIVDPSPDTA